MARSLAYVFGCSLILFLSYSSAYHFLRIPQKSTSFRSCSDFNFGFCIQYVSFADILPAYWQNSRLFILDLSDGFIDLYCIVSQRLEQYQFSTGFSQNVSW
ncbi:MAG: hypothetical protein Q4B82_04810 [Alysiella sp.]|uniref:hypothetical protein n=1 Tax=Alysiella sp. TaxID=1872483 RepID=UPI0026DAE589|nr:hypothetical protein [Alysiella sp.]MDO4433883.1 hypothetical protein [Alysiella sp.]